MKTDNQIVFFCLFVVGLAIGPACDGEPVVLDPEPIPGSGGHPDGWADDTHGPDADPNYDVVFDQSQVKRIDLVLEPDAWQTMLEDMTDMVGEFGSGGIPGGGEPPDMEGLIEACEDLEEGDPCVGDMMGMEFEGVCTNMMGQLLCMPDDIMGGGEMDLLPRDPVWVPCTVQFEDKEWWYVGIRFKGNSTLQTAWTSGTYKLPFKLDFDEFEDTHPEVDDQRFHGFKRVVFTNNGMDASYLRDKVAGDLFRASGVPTPWRAFYRVYIDVGEGPVYHGLYTVAEVPGRPMFSTQFGDTGGNLYKPDGAAASWEQGHPVDEDSFSKKTNEDEADWSDVENAIAALHADPGDAAAWRNEFEQTFDPVGFMNWLAVNTAIQDWDTYGNMTHNYYLYGDPANDGVLQWIPWDHNLSLASSSTMGAMGSPLPLDMSTVGSDWPLIRLLMDDPVYRGAYHDSLQVFIDGPFAVDDVQARLQAEHDLIAPFVTGEQGELPDYTAMDDPIQFEPALQDLLSHVADRHQAVVEYLATAGD